MAALYNSKSFSEAFEIAQKIRGTGPPIPIISEVEAKILEFLGDYKNARKIYIDLLREYPSKITYKMEDIRLGFRDGDTGGVKQTISSITLQEIWNDTEALMLAGQIRTLHRRDSGLLDPEEITSDCTVKLQGLENGQTKVFTILKEITGNQQQTELSLTSPLAQILLGKRKGDTVFLRQNDLEALSYEVLDIQSKYVFAFQETLKEFSTWFPDNSGIHQVEIAENDFSKIFGVLDKRHAFITKTMEFYKQNRLPLGGLGKMVGVSLFEIWGGMVSRIDGKIFASDGIAGEEDSQLNFLKSKPPLILDLTSLLTQNSLNHLERLKKCFPDLLVTQSVLDDINHALTEDFSETGPSMFLRKEGDHYVHRDVTSETLEARKNLLNGINEFIRNRTQIVPTPGILQLGLEKYKELKAVIGKSSLDSILTAKRHNGLLYSDELTLRQIAKNDWDLNGVWTQPVLKFMKDFNYLSVDDYYESLRKLILGNYSFVSLDVATMFFILKKYEWKPILEVSKIFESFYGPQCSEDSAVIVLSELLKKVWLETLSDTHKFIVLDLCLHALSTGRFGSLVIMKFKKALKFHFHLIFMDYQKISSQIDNWLAA